VEGGEQQMQEIPGWETNFVRATQSSIQVTCQTKSLSDSSEKDGERREVL
jgi:hypothetical protein